MPQLIKLLDNYISHYLGFGYGVGKGFVLAEEDVLKQFDNLQFIVNESIGLVMKTRVEKSRLDVLRSLCAYMHLIFSSCLCCSCCCFMTISVCVWGGGGGGGMCMHTVCTCVCVSLGLRELNCTEIELLRNIISSTFLVLSTNL